MSEIYNDEIGKVYKTKKANRLTQIGVGLLAVIIGLVMIASITAPMYVTSMVKDAGLSTAISHRLMDTVFDSLGDNMEALSQIQDSIEKSQIVDKLAQKYTSAMIKGMLDNKEFSEIDVNIDAELDELAELAYNGISSRISMGELQKNIVKAALAISENSARTAINNYVEGIYNNIYNRLNLLIKVYGVITSMTFKIIMFVLYVTTFVIIIVTNPVKITEYTLPCIFVITGAVYMYLTNVLGNRYVAAISNRYLGRTVFIDNQIAYKVMGVMCIFAVVSLVLCFICRLIKRKLAKKQ